METLNLLLPSSDLTDHMETGINSLVLKGIRDHEQTLGFLQVVQTLYIRKFVPSTTTMNLHMMFRDADRLGQILKQSKVYNQ